MPNAADLRLPDPGRRALLGAAALLGTAVPRTPAAAPPTTSAPPEALRRAVDAVVRPLVDAHAVPGLAVAVTVQGRAFFFNYGVVARGSDQPVTPATLFELGSVSKTFAATLATYAQALGRLSLDDAPSRHLPWLKGTPLDRASLLHLGTNTAGGLPLQFPDEVRSEADLVGYFRRWRPVAAPGTLREYSNPSQGLFGRCAAASWQLGYADALERELLPALGLVSTFVRVPPPAMARYAWGENGRGERVRVNPGAMADEAYGVKSSAEDMIRFVQLNIDPTRLPAPLRQALQGTQRGHFAVGTMVQGLGWEQYPYPVPLEALLQGNGPAVIFEPQPVRPLGADAGARGLFNKTGSTGGFGSYVAFVPQRRIGVVLLANRSYPIADRVRAGAAILEALAAVPP